jgi:hypothetical protein
MTVAFTRVGAGPPLLLLPGTACDGGVWRPVVPFLVGAREVIVVDLPGFGASAPLPAGVRPDPPALAAAVAGLLDELGIAGPVHVAGSCRRARRRSPGAAATGCCSPVRAAGPPASSRARGSSGWTAPAICRRWTAASASPR